MARGRATQLSERWPAGDVDELRESTQELADTPRFGHLLWRAGLRISEALSLAESDLDRARGAILVRRGKGGKRREVGMDAWAWDQLVPWLRQRTELPVGALFCIIHGPT
ncbi:MAG: tyrosine-type recombinase/integrase, partial [Actinobacteria bacterium]|nr:tyrosine-type recombinase/integrase [Actinomycetota bacterium]